MTEVERFVADEEGMRLYQQERLILEVTELIHQALKEKKVKRSRLAQMLGGMHRSRITQLLDGTENLTLRTIADVMTALGKMLCVKTTDLHITERTWEIPRMEVSYGAARKKPWAAVEGTSLSPYALAG